MTWAPSESSGAFQKCKRDAPLFVRTVSAALFAFEVDCRNIYRPFQEFLHLLGRV